MKRRDLLKTAAAATAAAVAAPYIRPAAAEGRDDALLTVSEGGPNNLDVMGIGTNLQGYEASWNTYDRLVSFGAKKDANGNDHYDPDKFEPELAESWDLGDISATFLMKRVPPCARHKALAPPSAIYPCCGDPTTSSPLPKSSASTPPGRAVMQSTTMKFSHSWPSKR